VKIRRVVVSLDPAPPSRAALEAAAALAARLDAELVGLFVEDVDLLHFAALPFAHEIGFGSAARRPLDLAAMELQLRALGAEVRQMLEQTAARSSLRWSFRVARGSPAAELLAAAAEADLVLAAAGLGPAPKGPLTLLAAVAYPAASAGAALGALAGVLGDGITVLLLAEDAAQARRWEKEAGAALAERGLSARFRVVRGKERETLAQLLGESTASALILAGVDEALGREGLRELMKQWRCPVFILH